MPQRVSRKRGSGWCLQATVGTRVGANAIQHTWPCA
jgi:hypothetical protein